jgi:probable DNA metabolism protein
MTIFRYDKTFEGLLTAVFDAYSRKTFPDALLAQTESAPLFVTEEHVVITDLEKSGRVWRALEKRLSKDVCNMLFFSWLSEEPGVDMVLMRYMRRVFDSPPAPKNSPTAHAKSTSVETDFSDPDILKVKKLAQKVTWEREHLMQFTRFQKGGPDPENSGPTYFAPVSPLYNALPLAIPYFRDRFRDQKWLIYDIKRRYGFYYDLHEVTEITMADDAHLLAGQLDETLLAKDEKLFQELWKSYFDSMAIAERINPRLQRQHMPRRFWHLLTEMK